MRPAKSVSLALLATALAVVAVLVIVATPRAARAEVRHLTLAEVITRAVASPRVAMATADEAAASARVDEADAARLPRVVATGFATLSPEIHCLDKACNTTTPKNFALRFSGLFAGADLTITQPLYTFGKLGHARAAARAGLAAQRALADEAAGDVAVQAAQAYWGLKLARELRQMLEEGVAKIDEARGNFDDKTPFNDRQRVAVLAAEAKAQLTDAIAGEATALAGLRALTGLAEADVDDAVLDPALHALPGDDTVAAVEQRRPQVLAARAGARAADELADFEHSQYFPDFALVGSAIIARAQSADDPPSVFANDPYNRSGAGAVLALRWTLEPWNTAARAGRAAAEARRAHAQADLAAAGARFDVQSARAEAIGARDRVAAAAEGQAAAETWLAAVLQNEALGVAEPKDLADAYLAWFQMHARWATAVFQWNVAVVRLGRATGEFRAGPAVP
jgi:outer membrane protein TolC